MSIKKMLFSGLLLGSTVFAAPDLYEQFFPNVPKLQKVECEKIEKMCDWCNAQYGTGNQFDNNSSQAELDQFRTLFVRLMTKGTQYRDILCELESMDPMKDQVAAAHQFKSLLQKISMRVQQDPELTNLVKNLVAFVAINFGYILDDAIPFFSDLGNLRPNEQERLAFLIQYLPQGCDLVQLLIEHTVWSHGYLSKQLAKNKHLTIDDIGQTIVQFGVLVKLPKKSQAMLIDLVQAISKGVKDLPSDIRNIKPIEDIIGKPEVEFGFRLLSSMAKMRRDIVATNAADQGKLIAYSKLMDQVIAQIIKAQPNISNVDVKKTSIVGKPVFAPVCEKLIFKQ